MRADQCLGAWSRAVRHGPWRIKPLEEMCERLAPLYALWDRKRDGRRFPRKDEMLPHAVKDSLRFLTLLRVLDRGGDFEFRLAGDAIQEQFGEHVRDKKVSELGLGGLADVVFRPVVSTGTPRLVEYRLQLSDCDGVRRQVLYLPLGDEQNGVEQILSMGVNLAPENAR